MSDLIDRLQAASRDDRLADGMLYREAAETIADLERQLAEEKELRIRAQKLHSQAVLERPTVSDEQLIRWAELCEKGAGLTVSGEIRAAMEAE